LGAILASGFYGFLKLFNYELANPGQDNAEGVVNEKFAEPRRPEQMV
jgi:hypothetical protein